MRYYDSDNDFFIDNYNYEDSYAFKQSRSYRKRMRIKSHPSQHIPNSNEAAVLRRLQAETGLTEKEIRSKLKYRIMLSAAQKKGQTAKRTKQQKFCDMLVHEACRQTKLAKEHPKTIEALQKIIDNLPKPDSYYFHCRCESYGVDAQFIQSLNAKKLIK